MARVLVPLADGCEELEAVTVIDLLRRADIEVVTAGLNEDVVEASRGVRLVPDATLDEALKQDYDMVVLPGGGPGAEKLASDERVTELLRRLADSEKFTAAICAGPKVLAGAGLLKGIKATSFPNAKKDLIDAGAEYSEAPVVQDGKVVTSRGPGTAMDFALHLIEVLAGPEKRAEVEGPLQRPGQGR